MNNPNNINYRDESYGSEKNWRIGTTDLKQPKEAYTVGTPYQMNTTGGTNIQSPSLDPEELYQVGSVSYHNGVTTNIPVSTPDMTNSGTNLNVSSNGINQSAKYKYPNVKQSTSQMPAEPNGDEPNI